MLEKNGRFLKVLKDPAFLRKLICVIIDEAHCVVNWGDFRPEYRELGLLQYVIPEFYPSLYCLGYITSCCNARCPKTTAH